MFTNIHRTRIEWGDCDPAGIIFYVRYFDIFDAATTALLERALGMKKLDYLEAYGILDHPLVDTRAKFRAPTRFGDEVLVQSTVIACGQSSFKIEHRLTLAGVVAVEGSETRMWAVRDPAAPGGMKSRAIPPEVVARLTQASAPAS